VILVDTDVLIAHLRGVVAAREWLRASRREEPLVVSVVTVAEITGGMRSGERREVWELLATMPAQPVNEVIGRRAGEYMRRYRRAHSGIGIADYFIAATAEYHGARLATLNVRHFPMFPDLQTPFATD